MSIPHSVSCKTTSCVWQWNNQQLTMHIISIAMVFLGNNRPIPTEYTKQDHHTSFITIKCISYLSAGHFKSLKPLNTDNRVHHLAARPGTITLVLCHTSSSDLCYVLPQHIHSPATWWQTDVTQQIYISHCDWWILSADRAKAVNKVTIFRYWCSHNKSTYL